MSPYTIWNDVLLDKFQMQHLESEEKMDYSLIVLENIMESVKGAAYGAAGAAPAGAGIGLVGSGALVGSKIKELMDEKAMYKAGLIDAKDTKTKVEILQKIEELDKQIKRYTRFIKVSTGLGAAGAGIIGAGLGHAITGGLRRK
jgi:hypothetical protein